MKHLLLTLALALLSACASQPPLPDKLPALALPMQLHIRREQAELRQDWLLVIQQEGSSLRWSMLDLLGIPQARQLLDHGLWQADGLLPPNPAARELFAALLFALTPDAQLQQRYPDARQQGKQRWLGERWRVDYREVDDFTLNLGQGLRYLVSPLPSETPP
ncbi:hypothetical protein D3C77_29640 [compost metagenome]|uniref:hypothetical protein n=1 Tax=Pseudomonas TaxID=286 RepID=UPI00041CACE4|nr:MULTISPECIES: hypothetical protein [Pseudomonas]MCW2268632.1 hypothetical protein [Pseudomonas sp. JUb96]PRA64844.1 hypothetical protein CQ065_12775 [Pseudomonas sp. MYb187]